MPTVTSKITPCLWFDTEAEDAAKLYTSLFPNSGILEVSHYGEAGPKPAGSVLTVLFELDGQRFLGLNGGPEYTFNEAVSFQVACKDQDEVDQLWGELTDGGEEGQCGWLKDRFGLSWQIIPEGLQALLGDPDPDRARRATEAMFQMKKLDLAAMERAAAGGA